MFEKISDKNYIKNSIKGFLVILVYFGFSLFSGALFSLFNVDANNIPLFLKIIYLLASDILIAAIIIFIFKDVLINCFNDLKKNHLNYFKKYIKYWFIALAIMMFSNLIIMLFTNNLPNNEEIIRQSFNKSPFYIFVTAVILAPIIEELVFRQAFRNIFTNNVLFVILSGLVFGGLHVFTSYENLTDLLYLIPYSAPGMVFAYTLVKSKNIFVPMGLHFIHNGLLVSLQFLILIFG
ncbi:MAG: CPBP family intramembrane glutamic endopeptidase [Bacilli bacterium]